ncbi:MAG: acyl-[acyl-carrier-protein]--UDP-N-acetylglucosamine O-acyltransferase [Gammaproteobacteria bacterium]|nr:MAG: acyl-[acyl-carrier-protein]--UDP-N-acetylglucosamine O-acyltransferase [Gammaproteobacteria bacterium]RLA15944.1 MAG: acyl-[acyl-carrier-protein]--UDP-N-acetylglucosamine O-acyltransferase [Gammaproteobacteria bacterium]RLA16977.1 MAG: acyl-[acyl-carrier-protein]--UDP-N-acetylglucosamine O-acyltransferase [Gammaproteobacteria bacterium]
MSVHPSAVIEQGAIIGEGTEIGPFSFIGAQVKLGKNCVIHSHVTIDGNTELGDGNEIFPYACIGKQTQDLKYEGGNPGLKIGANNSIREYVTINCATKEGDYTIVGSNCLIQAYVHVAHECILSDDVILSTGVKLSGHVEVGKNAILGGMTGVVQFVRIGDYAFVGGFAKLANDVPHYCIADGIPAKVMTINKIGLERSGHSKSEIREIYRAFKCVFKSSGSMEQVLLELSEMDNEFSNKFFDFIDSSKTRVQRG